MDGILASSRITPMVSSRSVRAASVAAIAVLLPLWPAAAAPAPCAADVSWGAAVRGSVFATSRDVLSVAGSPLLSLSCDDGTITATVGTVTDDSTTYIWGTAYATSDGKSFDRQIRLDGKRDPSGNWVVGRASAALPNPADTTTTGYLAAYVCRFVAGAWRCGCNSSTDCSRPAAGVFRWSLLAYRGTGDFSGTVTTTGGVIASRNIDASNGKSCQLPAAGPVTATAGQVIENMVITTDGTPGITVNVPGVTIRNVVIRHQNAPGITVGASGSNLRIERVHVENVGAPAAGPYAAPEANANIRIDGAKAVTVTDARLVRGSAGIHASSCDGVRATRVQGWDFRGSAPAGQLVLWDRCRNVSLEHFSVVSPLMSAWPEDQIGIIHTTNAYVNDGLIDGNSSVGGAGIQVVHDGAERGVIVENVDSVRARTAFFSAYPGNDVTLRNVRFGNQVCGDPLGRGAVCGDGTPWALVFSSRNTGVTMENAVYQNVCDENRLIREADGCTGCNIRRENFVPKAPLAIRFCWD